MGKREPLFPGGFRANGHRGGSKKGCPLTVLGFLAVFSGALTGVGYLIYHV